MMDAEQIAAGLTEVARSALPHFTSEWQAGPSLCDVALGGIKSLEADNMLERKFMDEGPPAVTTGNASGSARLSACWHFRLTPLGLAALTNAQEARDG